MAGKYEEIQLTDEEVAVWLKDHAPDWVADLGVFQDQMTILDKALALGKQELAEQMSEEAGVTKWFSWGYDEQGLPLGVGVTSTLSFAESMDVAMGSEEVHYAKYPYALVEAVVDRVGLSPRDAEGMAQWMARVAEKLEQMAPDWALMERGER